MTLLDPERLERILAPFARQAGPVVVVVEDPAGSVIAGTRPPATSPSAAHRTSADVRLDGVLIARVIASGPDPVQPDLVASIETLALSLGELAAEIEARHAAEAHRVDAAELAKGRRQQRSILSLVAPDVPGYDIASHYEAAREIGGDFFEVFRLRKRGRPLGIVVADVTGKGLDAALLMAFSRPLVHAALDGSPGPAEALERTNRVLVDEERGTLFITALCAVLDPRSGRLRVADAGHEPPLLVPGDGGAVREIGAPGVLLGMFTALGLSETQLELEPGDILFCYTDGVTDAVGPSGERFGDARLQTTIDAARGGSAHDLVASVRDAVGRFQGSAEPADDITIVAVGRHR